MLRTFASLGLTFGALAWALFASTFVFFYGSSFWIGALGRFGAFWGAVFAFVVALLIAKAMLRLADKLVEPLSGPFDARAYEGAPPDTFYRDWQRYAADVVRNRRYAYYMRTRQWDKAAELEKEIQATRRLTPDKMPEPPHPRRTSMAHRATWEENRRAARRASVQAPVMQKWKIEDE
jgi:hypothetical protein